MRVVSRSAGQKQEVYYPRVSAEAEDVRYTIRGFGVLIKNDFEVYRSIERSRGLLAGAVRKKNLKSIL